MRFLAPAQLEHANEIVREYERQIQTKLEEVRRISAREQERLRKGKSEFRRLLRQLEQKGTARETSDTPRFLVRQIHARNSENLKIRGVLDALGRRAKPLSEKRDQLESFREKLIHQKEVLKDAIREETQEEKLRRPKEGKSREGSEAIALIYPVESEDTKSWDSRQGSDTESTRHLKEQEQEDREGQAPGGFDPCTSEHRKQPDFQRNYMSTRRSSVERNSAVFAEQSWKFVQEQSFSHLTLRYPLSLGRSVQVRIVSREGKNLDICLLWPRGINPGDIFRVRLDILRDLRERGFSVRSLRIEQHEAEEE
ncbi:MAG: hypothetical protein KDD64_06345 [Bdellovibrionales bacterium]|nr:hypothetical protein [Bdellovibrionales bacterium]